MSNIQYFNAADLLHNTFSKLSNSGAYSISHTSAPHSLSQAPEIFDYLEIDYLEADR